MASKGRSKSNAVIKRDKDVMIQTTREPYGFVADHGEGDFVYDVDGNKFIDFSSFISVYNFGVNANSKVRSAIKSQMDKLMHSAFTDYYAEQPVRFAELLMKFMPAGFGRAFLSNSGTEANEAAIKFSKLFTKRNYTLAFYNAFHGRTKGSLALTASKSVQRAYNGPFPDTIHVPYPYCYRCPFKQTHPDCGLACVDYIKKYPLTREVNPKEVSALIAEPIQGEGGYVVPPKDYFKELRKMLDEHSILLIDDEVQAGYMRTGKFLALDNFGVKADIYTMAKSIGAGLPMGVTVARKSLGNIPEGAHANTFGGNLAIVAGALEQLKQVKDTYATLSSSILKKGSLAKKMLDDMRDSYEIVGDSRGMGLMLAIEIVKDKKTKEPSPSLRAKIVQDAYSNGLLLLPAGDSSIRVIPPLTVSEASLKGGLNILEQSIKKNSPKT